MRTFSIAFTISVALLLNAACSKKQPEQTAQTQAPPAAEPKPAELTGQPQAAASPNGETTPEAANPNDLPATVLLNDGSKYKGTLVSKTGSQLTFRGENGATRTFDSRDVKSIKFGEDEPAQTATEKRMRKRAPAETASNSAPPSAAPWEGQGSPAAAPAPPPPREITIPSGTQISVRTNEPIDSKTAGAGQTFSAMISESVRDDSGTVAIPRGSAAALVVRQAGAGKIHSNELVLDMASVTVGGKAYRVETADLLQKGKSGVGGNSRTGKFVGGGAALGAIIGAIAGGGKGAAIGAASGAGAGAGTQILTRGSVKVPAETILTFRLQAPLTLEAR